MIRIHSDTCHGSVDPSAGSSVQDPKPTDGFSSLKGQRTTIPFSFLFTNTTTTNINNNTTTTTAAAAA